MTVVEASASITDDKQILFTLFTQAIIADHQPLDTASSDFIRLVQFANETGNQEDIFTSFTFRPHLTAHLLTISQNPANAHYSALD